MLKKLVFIVLLAALGGCTSVRDFYWSPRPGVIPGPAGSEIQLFYASPLNDPFDRDIIPERVFEKRSGQPFVTGGIGLTSVWQF